jgi:hypothetical protein
VQSVWYATERVGGLGLISMVAGMAEGKRQGMTVRRCPTSCGDPAGEVKLWQRGMDKIVGEIARLEKLKNGAAKPYDEDEGVENEMR